MVRLNAEGYDDAILIDSVQLLARKLLLFLCDVGSATQEEIEAVHPFAFNKGGTVECFVQLKIIVSVGVYWTLTASGRDFIKTLMEQVAIQPADVDVMTY